MDNLPPYLLSLITSLKANKWTIASAESCTGGLIAGLLTELPGSSAWFERGFVTYSNLAKQEMLGVPAALIAEQGAVSEEVAAAMAQGALEHSAADLALSVTGIAGPEGGSAAKPVGTVCFAWAKRHGGVLSSRRYFPEASREEVRQLSCQEALEGMQRFLKD